MEQSGCGARVGASLLAVVVGLVAVPPAGAVETIVGTIQVSGAAWVASSSAEWSRLSSTRPLVAGDRLRTGSDGYLLADLGDAGVVGLYGNAEVATTSSGSDPVVDVQKGKVAFHLSPNSRMKLNGQGTGIASGTMAADGYVEYDANGTPVVVVEDGALNVRTASGDTKTLSRGDRLALGGPKAPAPVQIAQAEDDSSRKAGAVAGEEEPVAAVGGTQYAGLSVTAWAGVAVIKRLHRLLREKGDDQSQVRPLVASPRLYEGDAYRSLPSTIPDITEILGTRIFSVFPNIRRPFDAQAAVAINPTRRRAGLSEEDDEATTRERIAATVREHAPDAADREWIEPALLTLLGIEPAPAGGRDVLFAAWWLFFERIAAQGTTVLLFEDLQWADNGLLDFIDHLLEWSRGVPIVVVTLARPELSDRRPGWGTATRNLTSMALQPQSPDAMRELLDGFVPGLPPAAAEVILARAEGVPLYAVETIRERKGF